MDNALLDNALAMAQREANLTVEMREALLSGDLGTALDRACTLTNVKRGTVLAELARQHPEQGGFWRMIRALLSV